MTAEPPVPGPAPQETEARFGEPACDVCGGPIIEVRCKIICRRCGYTRDCSDP